ncbi:MAG TPA: TonB-dependent receptor [Steroidobacteraceae bacterium]|nr:TonB-dependent receptor [Steroidobacteraceae bacterium]
MSLLFSQRHATRAFYCCAIATLVLATPVLAQETATTETVVVTGSRIHQDPLNQPAPLVTVDDKDIAKSGLTSVGDVLQRMPVSGGGLNTKFNTSGNIGFPPDGGGVGAGAATADLRHLGPKRTLVLVDGIRWVNESSASGVGAATDLNTIPTSIIDHIEVLEDGASAIYGSDAIAGVINIITKKGYEGVEISGYGGGYDEGDGNTQQWNISAGATSEKTRAFFGLSYVDQSSISSADRSISEFPTPGAGQCTNRCSSGTPQARIDFNNPNTGQNGYDLTINNGVTGIPVYDPSIAPGAARTDDFHNFATADRFNFQPFNFIMSPSERIGLYGQVETNLSDNVSVYVKGLFNQRKSTNQAAPEPIFIGPEAGNGGGSLLDTTGIDINNPYNPFGFTLFGVDPMTGGTDYFVGRRPLEGGPRIFQQNVDTWYAGGGFRGNFQLADRDFYWDLNGVWSRNHADQTTHGSYNSLKIRNALGPGTVVGVTNFGFTQPATATACGAVTNVGGVPTVVDPTPNCVPLNLLGGQGDGSGTISAAQIAYIQPVLHDTSEQELKDFTANISGTIMPLPAGGLDFALGYEHRKQDGFYQPDAIYPANESAGVPSGPTSGSYDVNEVYGEIQIPILKGVAGADLLQVSAALRWFDYSTFGSDTTSKFGLNWRPVSDLLVRGTWGQGFRAPGIGELFGTFSRFDQTLTDPCSAPVAPANVANCATLGVPPGFSQLNAQISVITGGNPDLKPETSEGYTAGLVYSPRWAEGASWSDSLSLELTYYSIKIDDTIQARDAQAQLDGCVATLDAVLCNGISRTAGGTINGFNNALINIGGTDTAGYDLNVRWVMPETSVGRFTLNWQNTWLDKFVESTETATGFVDTERKGTERGSPSQSYPEWKSALTVDWGLHDFGASTTIRYTDSLTEPCRNIGAFAFLCSDPVGLTNKMNATTYVDLQASWSPSRLAGWTFAVGINNLFNEDPPNCYSCELNGFDGSTYDVPGMFWYGRVVAHFGGQ